MAPAIKHILDIETQDFLCPFNNGVNNMKRYQVENLTDCGDDLCPENSMIFHADHKAHVVEQFFDALPNLEEALSIILQITLLKEM